MSDYKYHVDPAVDYDWELAEVEAEAVLFAGAQREEYDAGRELFLNNCPLHWCANADQRDGWLDMLPPELRTAAVQDALAFEYVYNSADELPY